MSAGKFRTKVVGALLLAGLVPLLLFGAVTWLLVERSVRNDAVALHQAILRGVTSGVELYIDARRARLEALARNPGIQSLDPERVHAGLAEFIGEEPFFRGAALIDTASIIRGSFSRDVRETSWNDGEKILALPDAGTGARSAIASTEAGILLIQVPVTSFMNDDVRIGTLLARGTLTGPDIQDILDTLPVPEAEYVCLLDRNGEITALRGAGLPQAARRIVLPASLATSSEALPEPTYTLPLEHGGRTDLVSLTWRPSLNGWVVAGTPVTDAFRLLASLRTNFGVVLLAAALIAVLAGALVAASVTRPIAILVQGLAKLRDGEFSHRVSIGTGDELDEAGRGLNALAAVLQKKLLIGSIWERIRGESKSSTGDRK